jgi:hypothetical protein
MGAHTLLHGIEKNRELKEKGEASPPTRKRVEASPKAKKGIQEKEGGKEMTDITPKGRAVLDAAGIKPKPFPHERPRWKASEQELREFERMADGEELPEQEPPKPKPLPITPRRSYIAQ